MADKQVRIVISAQDSFSAVMQKYSTAMGKAAADTKKMDDAGKQADGGLTGLNNTMNNLMGVFAGIQILNVVGDMVSLGNAANATNATFTALSGGAEQAATTMRSLRDATGGVVADTELMAGANRLLAMNIATTGQQAAELSAVAVNLGRAFGQDASTAIENFSLMIANQSLLRLDSLGISAAAVRARMAELKDEFPEMDKQARFTTATLEQAEVAVDRLGSSITAGQTPVAQLTVKFENFKTSIGQGLATTINTAITAIEQLETISQVQFGHALPEQQQGIIDNARFFAEAWGEEFGARVGTLGMPSDFNPTEMLQRIEEARMTLGTGATSDQLVQKAGEDMWYSQANIDRMKQVYAIMASEIPEIEARNARAMAKETQLTDFRIAEAQRAQEGIDTAYADAMYQIRFGGLEGMTTEQQNEMKRFQAMMDSSGAPDRIGQSNVDYAADKMYQLESNVEGMARFIDPAALDDVKARFEELQELNERGLITDESLEKAAEFRDRAQEAADAFAKMSLTDIFGQTNGGMQGEIGDLVIDKMRENGATDEQIAAAQEQFNLGSGRETGASQAMDTTLAPMIADLAQTDPALAQKAVENVNAFLQSAALMNLTPDQIAAGLPGAAGFMPVVGSGGMGGGSFSIKPGQTLSEISAQTGIPVEQLLAATGAASANVVQPGTYGMGGGSYMPTPGFDPHGYAQGWQNPYSAMPGAGGAAPSPFMTNPILGMGAEAWGAAEGAAGEAAGGTNPLDMAAVASEKIKDNTADIIDQVDQIATGADAVTKAFDSAAAPRTMQITVETIDKTGGLLKAILGGLTPGTIQLGTGTRDNGGRVAGADGRVGQQPGITR
jgi:hypothetical protein